MGGQGVEKRVAGIVRWLERFQRSYRSGAMESALMDAECARADLETLRRDVWFALDPSCVPPRRMRSLVCRVALLAFLMVLALSAPVSELRRSVDGEEALVPQDSLFAWAALNILDVEHGIERDWRPNAASVQSEGENLTVVPQIASAVRADIAPRMGSASRSSKKNGAVVGGRGADVARDEKKVSYETIYTLLQTGERVLKKEEPVIMIDRRQGKGAGGL